MVEFKDRNNERRKEEQNRFEMWNNCREPLKGKK